MQRWQKLILHNQSYACYTKGKIPWIKIQCLTWFSKKYIIVNGRTIFIVLFLNVGPNFFPKTVNLKRFDLNSTYLFGANFASNEYQVHATYYLCIIFTMQHSFRMLHMYQHYQQKPSLCPFLGQKQFLFLRPC